MSITFIAHITYDNPNIFAEAPFDLNIFILNYNGEQRYFMERDEYTKKDFYELLNVPQLKFLSELLKPIEEKNALNYAIEKSFADSKVFKI